MNQRDLIMTQVIEFDPELTAAPDVWEMPQYNQNCNQDEGYGGCSFTLREIDEWLARVQALGYTEFKIDYLRYDFKPKFGKTPGNLVSDTTALTTGTGPVFDPEPPAGTPQWWFYKGGMRAVNFALAGATSRTEMLRGLGGFMRYPHQRFSISVPLTRWMYTYPSSGSANGQALPDLRVNTKHRWMSLVQPQDTSFYYRLRAFDWACETFSPPAAPTVFPDGEWGNVAPWRITGKIKISVRKPMLTFFAGQPTLAEGGEASARSARAALDEEKRRAHLERKDRHILEAMKRSMRLKLQAEREFADESKEKDVEMSSASAAATTGVTGL